MSEKYLMLLHKITNYIYIYIYIIFYNFLYNFSFFFSDLYTSRYYNQQCTSLTDQPTQKKLVLQTFSCPRDSSGTTSKCVYKSDLGHITGPDHSQMPSGVKPPMAADTNPALLYSQPRKLKDRKTSAPTPDPEPQSLPSVPQVPHSDRPRQGPPSSEKPTAGKRWARARSWSRARARTQITETLTWARLIQKYGPQSVKKKKEKKKVW